MRKLTLEEIKRIKERSYENSKQFTGPNYEALKEASDKCKESIRKAKELANKK